MCFKVCTSFHISRSENNSPNHSTPSRLCKANWIHMLFVEKHKLQYTLPKHMLCIIVMYLKVFALYDICSWPSKNNMSLNSETHSTPVSVLNKLSKWTVTFASLHGRLMLQTRPFGRWEPRPYGHIRWEKHQHSGCCSIILFARRSGADVVNDLHVTRCQFTVMT